MDSHERDRLGSGERPGQPTSFVIRLWLERSPQGTEWRGHVTHVQDQAEAYFRDFRVLLDFLGRHSGATVPLKPGGGSTGAAPGGP